MNIDVRALARDLQVPLLVLESNVLAPYDFGEDCLDEGESDDENAESGEECASESEVDDENDASSEEERTSSNEGRTDCSDDDGVDVEATAEAALKKLVLPFKSEDFEKSVLGEPEMSESTKSETVEPSNNSKRPLRKASPLVILTCIMHHRIALGKISTSDGPRNAYTIIHDRCLSSGQRGEEYEVNKDRVAVILDIDDESKANEEGDEKTKKQVAKGSVYWIDDGVIRVTVIQVLWFAQVGVYHSASLLVTSKPPTPGIVSRGIALEGFCSLLAGIWGSGTGSTTLTENVHTINITKVANRRAVELGAAMLILFSFVGKIGAVLASIPLALAAAILCFKWALIVALGL
ncbi:hypothetical protein HS088_TW05G00038 [Tripterygium wilfordii]|uniref:Uncharacterized protein n=1 Tax=Tripterygium wilfordii TaxID=458696 RepID=A0A7J7DLW2_TRIWF|nr:hypothetical protein HS088_TW05G00038 [Tripterygium wilfordii]